MREHASSSVLHELIFETIECRRHTARERKDRLLVPTASERWKAGHCLLTTRLAEEITVLARKEREFAFNWTVESCVYLNLFTICL